MGEEVVKYGKRGKTELLHSMEKWSTELYLKGKREEKSCKKWDCKKRTFQIVFHVLSCEDSN